MRKELIARLQKVADTLSLAGLAVTPDLLRQAADMLEADQHASGYTSIDCPQCGFAGAREMQPAATQEPVNIRHRWNIEPDGNDLLICENNHDKGEKCEYVRYVRADATPQPQQPRLTDEEILNIHALPCWVRMQFADKGYGIALDTATVVDFARAIEKKVRGEI